MESMMKKRVPTVKGMKPLKKMPKGSSAGRSSKVKPAQKPVGIPAMKMGRVKTKGY